MLFFKFDLRNNENCRFGKNLYFSGQIIQGINHLGSEVQASTKWLLKNILNGQEQLHQGLFSCFK